MSMETSISSPFLPQNAFRHRRRRASASHRLVKLLGVQGAEAPAPGDPEDPEDLGDEATQDWNTS